ncbi:MAG TPA: hypothetical protein VGC99_03495, partial [Candidatus Tectomicrobia bacterium]
ATCTMNSPRSSSARATGIWHTVDTADEDLKSFQKAKEARDELSHGQEVEDSKLPVEAARLLVKRYLMAHLNRSA